MDLELIHFRLFNFNDFAIFDFDPVFSILLEVMSPILEYMCVDDYLKAFDGTNIRTATIGEECNRCPSATWLEKNNILWWQWLTYSGNGMVIDLKQSGSWPLLKSQSAAEKPGIKYYSILQLH